MKLVDDAANWWKWHSAQAFAVLTVLPVVWASSADLQALIPPKYAASIGSVIAVLGLIGRVHKQSAQQPPTPTVPQPFDSDPK